jgi:parvulin-like peptidyl-prolyl isomerase
MKFITLSIVYIFLAAALADNLSAQTDDNKELARVGSKVITLKEFKDRYELTPQIGRHVQGREEYLKAELLYSMIAEKLWAIESENLGYDTTDIMNLTYKALEKMYWRDALYQEEVRKQVVIAPEEYTEARRRSSFVVNTWYLYSEEKEKIDSLYRILENGFPFDSLLAIRPEAALQDTAYVVYYGRMDEQVEDEIYSKNPGEFTTPLKSPDGWYIFKVASVIPVAIQSDKEAKLVEQNIRKTVEGRATQRVYAKYYRSLFKTKKVNADGELFWSFSDKVISIIQERAIELTPGPGENIHLEADDYYRIAREVGTDSLNMVFIKFETDPVTLKQFLHEFVFEGFYTNNFETDNIRARLNGRVKGFIEKEILAREALSKGLNNYTDNKHFLEMWHDNYMGTLYKRKLMREVTVSEEEVYEEYSKEHNTISYPKQVNIIEILTDSLEVIEIVLQELDKGTDIGELAVKYSKRESTKNTGGEFGLFPTTSYGEIGRVAGALEVGEIFGPLETDEGYSIFKVIDKKDEQEKLPKSFEEIKEELTTKIKSERASASMIDNTVELANKYGVTVDENLLYNVEVNNLTMVVYRYMGFGGRILAVPMAPPFIEWVEEWQQSKESLP